MTLQQTASMLIEKYRHEITRDGDWWWGNGTHSFNIYSPEGDGWFNINVYTFDAVKGVDNYDTWIDLEPRYLGG